MLWLKKQGLGQGIFRYPGIVLHHDHGRDSRSEWDPKQIVTAVENYSCDDWGLDGVELPEWRKNAS